MAKPPVEFHPEARAEYLAALAWYRERSPAAARQFEAEASRSIQQIRNAPGRWTVYNKDYRRFLLHWGPHQPPVFHPHKATSALWGPGVAADGADQFPFQIIYQMSPDRIFVLAVAHCHRRPQYWRDRS